MSSPPNSISIQFSVLLSGFLSSLFLFSFLSSFAQVQIWGVSQTGGSDQIGSVFNIMDTGLDYQFKSEFINSQDGEKSKSHLVVGSDGVYYGITSAGGANNAGTIFRYSDENGFEVLYNLNSSSDGKRAEGDMIEISNGVFVGSTLQGGQYGSGTLFRFSLTSGYSVLHHFNSGVDGANPKGSLAFNNSQAKVYGACSNGGNGNFGTCFAYSFATGYQVIHHFTGGAAGSYPLGGVILAADGKLYGTTQSGGANSQGSIFKLNPSSNAYTTLYSISAGASDGRYPYGNLLESSPGVFLGTCSEGGTNGTGTVYKVTSDGVFTRLKSLQPTQNGAFPKSGLGKSDDGIFYGVTEFGGLNGFGTIYTVTGDGTFTKVHDIDYTADGANPASALVSDGNGGMIGTMPTGGANNYGTIYQLTPENEVVKLHDFSLPLEGATPISIIKNGNQFFGITSTGGLYNTGVFYSIQLDGTREDLHDFNLNTEGQNPNGDLFLADDGKYYGTARFGGSGQSGTIFSITEDGTLEVLHSFDTSETGQFPYGGVVKTEDGTIYGTTIVGGMYSYGTFYSLSPEGDYSVLYDFFSPFDGGSPEASLTIGADGKIYGLTTEGGSYNAGSLFNYDPATNTLTVDYNFNPDTDGQGARGILLLHSDGSLYGTTTSDLNGGGAIFRYNPGTGMEVLHAFNPSSDGKYSAGGLSEDEQGHVIGFCSQGGNNNKGTCFSYSDTDGFELIYSFSSAESPGPVGKPALFFPECYGNEGCTSTEPCAVAICDYGICKQVPINPNFTALTIGQCEVGLDMYDLVLGVTMDINAGGTITIAGQSFGLLEGVNSYQFTLTGLPADAQAIALDYTFDATGCTGSTGVIGTAPVPCPPVLITFVLDAGDLAVSDAGIHVGGSFQGWAPAEYPMTLNADGFWETTVTIGSGSYQFNFFNGLSIFDAEFVIGECATNGKRNITVGEESQTVNYCWAKCLANCSVGINELTDKFNFEIVPNIATRGSEIYLNMDKSISSLVYSVIDVTGKVLATRNIEGERTHIATGDFASGIYNLMIRKPSTGEILGVKRFMIE